MGMTGFVGVIGSGNCSVEIYTLARNLGFEIGKKSWALVCGGLGGVMEGAARGCREAGGLTIGLLPGLNRHSANPYISVSFTHRSWGRKKSSRCPVFGCDCFHGGKLRNPF